MARRLQLGFEAPRELLLYYGSRLLTQTAQNLFLAGLFVAAGTSSRAATDLSSVFVATLVPAVILGPFGGALADRLGARTALPAGAALRFAVVLGGAFLLDGPEWAWAAAFAYSAVSQLYTPAELAIVRALKDEAPAPAHAWLVTLQFAGQGAGMVVLAPVLYWQLGLSGVLLAAAAGLAANVGFTFLLRVRLAGTTAAVTADTREAFAFGAVLRFFLEEGAAAYSVIGLAARSIVARSLIVAMPLYLTHDMGLDQAAVVYLAVPGVAGVVLGLFWYGRRTTTANALSVLRVCLVTLAGAAFAASALDYGVTLAAQYSQIPPIARAEASINTTFAVGVPVAFAVGLALTASLVAGRAILSAAAPPEQQGRVFAVQEMVSETLVALPLLAAGIGTEFLGARPVLATVGAIAAAAWVVGELLLSRSALRPAEAGAALS